MSEKDKPPESLKMGNAKEIINKLAEGEIDETRARWQAKKNISVLEEDRDRINASSGAAKAFKLPDNITRLEKERLENMEERLTLINLRQELGGGNELLASERADTSTPSHPRINIRGGLKELASILLELENAGKIDHVEDKDAAQLFTIHGTPVIATSLKTIRNRDL